MALRCFEDIAPGTSVTAGPYEVTPEAVRRFALAYDPQPFHLDEAAGLASPLGGLAASGWHTGAIGMRLLYDGFLASVASMGGPGIAELKWLQPVRPGDVLSARIDVAETRPSASRPDMGLLGMLMTLTSGVGVTVMTQRFTLMVARRVSADGATPPIRQPSPTQAAPASGATVLGTETFTADKIKAFAAAFDPQPFHLDEQAAQASHFGALVASGWHVAACWMKHMIADAAGRRQGVGRISPGFRDMRWIAPVRAGDAITYATRIDRVRPIARPGWELLVSTNTGTNADGRCVFAFSGTSLRPRSPAD